MPDSTVSLKISNNLSMEMIHIPAGKFLMGSDKKHDKYAGGDETPQHTIQLDDYWIGKYPVSIAQYKRFVSDTGYRPPAELGNAFVSKETENCPVTGVGWHDGRAFCYWLHWLTKEFICLPTEAEWEKAARGPDGFIWPWGNKPLNSNILKPKSFRSNLPIGTYSPTTDSPYGCVDMVTNVSELCNTARHKGFMNFYKYPYNMNDGRESNKTDTQRSMRGGGLYQILDDAAVSERDLRTARRQWLMPKDTYSFTGIRVIMTKLPERWKIAFPDTNEKKQLELGLNLQHLQSNELERPDVVGYETVGVMLDFSHVDVRCSTSNDRENIFTMVKTLTPNVKGEYRSLSDILPGSNLIRLSNLLGKNKQTAETIVQNLLENGWQLYKPEIDRKVGFEEWVGLEGPKKKPEDNWIWLRRGRYS